MIDPVTGTILVGMLVNLLATFASALTGNYWLTIANIGFGVFLLCVI
jgi:hypothetical protein